MNKDLPLKLKYRPQDFEHFIGNDTMVKSLRSVLGREEGRPHTILLEGSSGCGKTTLAKIISKELGCSRRDFQEMNISQFRGIDTAREIIGNASLVPWNGPVKVYVLDEVHSATKDFQNAMLDILEQPPAHVYFILCTTEPEKLLKTIRGQRATIFRVSLLPRNKIVDLLEYVCGKEEAEFPERHLQEIARVSEGSPRKALDYLDQIIDIEDDDTAFQAIIDATVDEAAVIDICRGIMKAERWSRMAKLLRAIEADEERIRYAVLGYFGSVMLNETDEKKLDRVSKVISMFEEPFYTSKKAGLVNTVFMACQL